MTIKEIIKEAAILDVRTPQEFNEGHYEGAINIPVD
ncbi:MAG: rhodanese-like domain-containing protein, partial [Candidatus Dadabacteria bacterium]